MTTHEHPERPEQPKAPDRVGPVARTLVAAVTLYRRAISPLLPPRCRYYPTCSEYAVQAVTVHGAARGSWLAVRRILRCHPFHRGGLDPVPPRTRGTRSASDVDRTTTGALQ